MSWNLQSSGFGCFPPLSIHKPDIALCRLNEQTPVNYTAQEKHTVKSTRLHCLAQSHVISQDAVESLVTHTNQPTQTLQTAQHGTAETVEHRVLRRVGLKYDFMPQHKGLSRVNPGRQYHRCVATVSTRKHPPPPPNADAAPTHQRPSSPASGTP